MRPTLLVLAALTLLGCDDRAIPQDSGRADLSRSEQRILPTCGDPKVMTAFLTCRAAKSQSDCEQAGGRWTRIGLSPEPGCVCPTGQSGCACTRAADCVATCVAEMVKMWECPMTTGTCVEQAPVVGCRCWLRSGGTFEGLCAD